GLAVAGRAAEAGQGQPPGSLARPDRLLRARRPAEPARVHRRGGARRLRSAQVDTGRPARRGDHGGTGVVGEARLMAEDAPLLDVRDLHVAFRTPTGGVEAVRGASFVLDKGETLAV